MANVSREAYDDYRVLLRRGLCPVHAEPMRQILANRPKHALHLGREHCRVMIVACPNPSCGFRGYTLGIGQPVTLFGEFLFLLGTEPVRLDVASNECDWSHRWSADVAHQLIRRALAVRNMITGGSRSYDPYVHAGRRTVAQMASVARRVEQDQHYLTHWLLYQGRGDTYAWKPSTEDGAQSVVWQFFFVLMRRLQDTVDYVISEPQVVIDTWLDWFLDEDEDVILSADVASLAMVFCSLLREVPTSSGFDRKSLESAWMHIAGQAVSELTVVLEALDRAGSIELTATAVSLVCRS